MEDGQAFNPFQLFTGIFIPEWLARSREVSAGAKMAYGRLARYAGENGLAYPSVPTLAKEIGYDVRQTQRYLAELQEIGLIAKVARVSEIGQSSNLYRFLWQSRYMSPGPLSDLTPPPVSELTPKESHIEESHSEITATVAVTPRLLTQEAWPLTTALIQRRWESVDSMFVLRLVHESIQRIISVGVNPMLLTDTKLAEIVQESIDNDFNGPKKNAAVLWKTVPNIIETRARRNQQ